MFDTTPTLDCNGRVLKLDRPRICGILNPTDDSFSGDGLRGDVEAAVAQGVAELIATYAARGIRLRAVMLDRLGPNVWHDDPASAAAVLEELEETARLAMLAGDDVVPLEAAQIQELRDTFGAHW